MKLYTEEQVINIFEKYGNMSGINARNIIDLSEYIELPSDEEIENESEFIFYNDRKFKPTIYEIMALRIGAKWMRDKLTNTKEK